MNHMTYSRATIFGLAVLATSVFCQPMVKPVCGQEIKPWVKEQLPELGKVYLEYHQTPELSFQEEETGKRLSAQLKAAGFETTGNVGGFGVVGILENGEGPTVMVRTDLDALPVTEETNLPYASKVKVTDASGATVGVMHACGHDIHLTCVVGTARYLAEHRDQWSGRLMMIGQPAEERGAGALAMLEDGLFEKYKKPDFALALHCHSSLATGKIAMRPGYSMANVDSVDVTLFGSGGHGAYPHTTIDPIVQAAKFVMDVQTIVSREIAPIEPSVITVGSIHAGTKHNIISDQCHLQLTVRSYSEEVRTKLIEGIKRKAKAAAESVGAKEPEIKVSEGTPSLFNDEELTARIRAKLEKTVGKENVIVADQVMGGEDFSQYGRAGVPILMYSLGTVEQKRLDRFESLKATIPSLHSPRFFPDFDPTIETGVTTMVSSVLELMKK
jgi:hippurate hydrolase